MPTAHEVYRILGNESVWKSAHDCSRALAKANIPHALLGGVAVCLHGYKRNTVAVDILIRRADIGSIRSMLGVFSSPVRTYVASEPAGKGSEVKLPDPTDEKATSVIEGVTVLTLAKLVESKLACGEAEIRRTHKDFADVVELIACNGLAGSFARKLHKSVQPRFKELLRMARG
jgi:hypothetical protein